MRVFVTGATGFIGSAVVQELIASGHTVLGLARSEQSAHALIEAGAEVRRGDIQDLDSLLSGAAACDGVIHTGFIHDFSRFKEVCEIDRGVIEAIGSVLEGSDRPFIVTSGTALVAAGTLAIETDMPPAASHNPRIASEQAVDALAARGVRVAVVRLPPSVHGDGDHGFVPLLINLARQKGIAAYKGEGQNRWPAVHKLDAANLYRLALEKIPAPGTRYHANAEEGIAFKMIAEVIGKHLNIPVESKSPEEAAIHFDWFAHFASIDNPCSSKHTQQILGWQPKHSGLLEDIDRASYFSV